MSFKKPSKPSPELLKMEFLSLSLRIKGLPCIEIKRSTNVNAGQLISDFMIFQSSGTARPSLTPFEKSKTVIAYLCVVLSGSRTPQVREVDRLGSPIDSNPIKRTSTPKTFTLALLGQSSFLALVFEPLFGLLFVLLLLMVKKNSVEKTI